MIERKIVLLRFSSPLHIGSDIQGIGKESINEIIHSDTLFSAIVNNYSVIAGSNIEKIQEFIDDFKINIRLSSALPYSKTNNSIDYFFLKPRINPPDLFVDAGNSDKDISDIKKDFGKDLKKINYLSFETFHKWITGVNIDFRKTIEDNKNRKKTILSEIRPQNYQDRLTKATGMFHTGLLHFSKNAGLYFLIEKEDKSQTEWSTIEAILNLCAINGLGGRKSVGNGLFEYDVINIDNEFSSLFNFPPGNSFLNLSLYHPSENDNNYSYPIAYDLIPRRGWTFSNLTRKQVKRKTCNMFAEFSVFRQKPVGEIVDVTPDIFVEHPIYRYGIPIVIPTLTYEN